MYAVVHVHSTTIVVVVVFHLHSSPTNIAPMLPTWKHENIPWVSISLKQPIEQEHASIGFTHTAHYATLGNPFFCLRYAWVEV